MIQERAFLPRSDGDTEMTDTQTPDTDQILAALAAAGLTITGTQIEADSIDIHLDKRYAGFNTNYRAVSLSWRPEGLGWYLLPLDPEDETAPAEGPDYLAGDGSDLTEVVREVMEMLAYSDEWIEFVAARRAAESADA
jgi:hypothetical protein